MQINRANGVELQKHVCDNRALGQDENHRTVPDELHVGDATVRSIGDIADEFEQVARLWLKSKRLP